MPLSARGNDFDDDFGDDEEMPEPGDFSDYEDIEFDGWETFEEDEY